MTTHMPHQEQHTFPLYRTIHTHSRAQKLTRAKTLTTVLTPTCPPQIYSRPKLHPFLQPATTSYNPTLYHSPYSRPYTCSTPWTRPFTHSPISRPFSTTQPNIKQFLPHLAAINAPPPTTCQAAYNQPSAPMSPTASDPSTTSSSPSSPTLQETTTQNQIAPATD